MRIPLKPTVGIDTAAAEREALVRASVLVRDAVARLDADVRRLDGPGLAAPGAGGSLSRRDHAIAAIRILTEAARQPAAGAGDDRRFALGRGQGEALADRLSLEHDRLQLRVLGSATAEHSPPSVDVLAELLARVTLLHLGLDVDFQAPQPTVTAHRSLVRR